MNEKTVRFEDVAICEEEQPKKKSLLKKAVSEVKYLAWCADNWIYDHKNEIVLAAGAGATVITAASGLVRAVNNSSIGVRRQKNAKDLTVYDRSAGHYWTLRRKLSNSEWAEVEQRKRNGERIGDILESMKALK